ncbi:MAG: hypothetical protein SchgKO_15480 [Schleiferiaceae bacterium]
MCICFLGANAQNAIDFDGVNDVVQTTYSGISGSSARTVEAWIKTSTVADPNSGGTQMVIADWGDFVTGGRSTFNVLWGNTIRFEVGGSGINGTTAVNDGLWHHVAYVYNPSATEKISLYVDGILETSGNITTTVNTQTTTPLRIGNRIDNAKPFDGVIDEVRVWNTARTASEILNNKDIEFCSPQTGLVAYYRLNQGVAGGTNTTETVAYDDAGSNNGNLLGFALSGTTSNWVAGASLSGNSFQQFSDTACQQYITPSGQIITQTGVYADTLPAANGCDSILEYAITINSVDTSVYYDGFLPSLTASSSPNSYTWIDCSTGMPTGDTTATFVPAANGSYAVVVEENGCVDTSNCYLITTVSLPEIQDVNVTIYPNPSTALFVVEWPFDLSPSVTYSVFTLDGREALTGKLTPLENKIDLGYFDPGIYFLQLRGPFTLTKKIEKQ